MNLPCKENKCILLPTCQFKKDIDCDQLQTCFLELMKEIKNFNEVWDVVHSTLYNLYRLQGNGRVFFDTQVIPGPQVSDPKHWK